MNTVLVFLNSNFFQTLAVVLGAFITFVVFKRQKSDEIRNAASLLILEIDSIIESAEKLKNINIQDYEQVYRSTPLYQKLDWYKFRGILVSKMDVTHIQAINKFYENAILLEEARQSFKNAVVINRTAKIEAIQGDISKILFEDMNKMSPSQNPAEPLNSAHVTSDMIHTMHINVQNRLYYFKLLYDNNSRDFIANGVAIYFEVARGKFISLTNTPAYDSFKKLSEDRRKLKLW